ncbi:tetratricopeptide repeat protein [Sulfuriferula nivalis]|uniref:Sel1 repeat family protein n=1 Tax=Sulfuriferula nivalis TaxID=2675298 RepID=A0A809RKI5_9PROT|nr:tetratricopeptide repeat protein [Sulfuriferula nivalis]BBP01314.1 hypothetical protein SFSGTM_20220 [Sulfuriferula nivalis]
MRHNKLLSIISIALSSTLVLVSGNAVAMDDAQAKQLFTQAYQGDATALQQLQQDAIAGSANTEFWYGVYFEVNEEYVNALAWLKKSSVQGFAAAQGEIGVLYHDGQGVPQDYAQAVSWYKKAADQGNTDAQNNLGVLYQNGQGIPQNYAQAATWFRKAAN